MRNKGLTFIGMLLTAAIVIVCGIVIMRIIPVYIQSYEVDRSISSLERIPAEEFSTDPASNAKLLREKLINQLYVNGIELPPENITISPDDKGNFTVAINYTVTRFLFANVSLLFDFKKSQEVKVSGE